MRTAVLLALALCPAAVADDGHKLAGNGFSAVFPGKPKEANQTAKTPVGDLKVYTATFATADGNVFLLSHTEFPAEAVKADNHPALFDGVREGLKGKDGKLVSEKPVEVGAGKLAGREVVVDKGKRQTRFRLAVKGNRLYQVAAVGTGEFVTGAEATAFLDSLDLGK